MAIRMTYAALQQLVQIIESQRSHDAGHERSLAAQSAQGEY